MWDQSNTRFLAISALNNPLTNGQKRSGTGWKAALGVAVGLVLAPQLALSAEEAPTVPAAPAAAAPGQDALEDIDYGQFYVLQRRITPRPWEVGVNYSYGNNAFYGIHGLSLQLQRQFGTFVLAGIYPSWFIPSDTGLADTLKAIITSGQAEGVNTLAAIHRPNYEVLAGISALPLAGLLNVMNITTRQFDFAVGVRAGVVKYEAEQDPGFSIKFLVAPRLMVSEQVGFQTQLGFSLDRLPSDGTWLQRIDASAGVFVRF